MVECRYAECHLCKVSIILSVANKPIMPSVVMLSVVMLSVENKPIMLSVVMLSVVAPSQTVPLVRLSIYCHLEEVVIS